MRATPPLASCRHLPMLPGNTAVQGTGASVLPTPVFHGLPALLSLHQRKRHLRRGIHPTLFGHIEAVNTFFFSAVNRRMWWGICDLDTTQRIFLYPTGLLSTGSVLVMLKSELILQRDLSISVPYSVVPLGLGKAASALP